MAEDISCDRRCFLGTAAMTMAAAGFAPKVALALKRGILHQKLGDFSK